jgi:hypothetical protein
VVPPLFPSVLQAPMAPFKYFLWKKKRQKQNGNQSISQSVNHSISLCVLEKHGKLIGKKIEEED